jgi:hypothetical protein
VTNPTWTQVLEVFIDKDRDAWRLYTSGWIPPHLRAKLDEHGEAFPVAEPDLEKLDKFMWAADAPYEKTVTKRGGVELKVRGRSAVVLWEWLAELVENGRSD